MSTISSIQPQAIPQPQPVALTPASGTASSASAFGAVLDAINPLQHIPIVSSIFRASQGTAISPVSQIAGDTLYGGLIGGAISSFVSSVADVAVKGVTGKGIGEHVIATLEGDSSSGIVPSGATTTAAAAFIPAATSDAPAPAEPDATLTAKADDAVKAIYRFDAHPERVAAQYKRVQTLDIGNKLLISKL